ncbi:MAG: glutamine synthetase type III [Halobacteriovoraceae bacterium]|nr:glutamine synthetase type III [Halobacteriovoraceae bacterium]|tara:strand:- start:1243 stop:3441 length:2199 start_codon:yes stop_codon:yes gene_type:complete
MTKAIRAQAQLGSFKVPTRKFKVPSDVNGNPLRVSEYFGENVFDYMKSEILTKQDKQDIQDVLVKKKDLTKEMADKFANAVLNWATGKGATHFTHWFQPMTGSTAEKHDAFLSIEKGKPIEKLSATQLIQGEPDASSFPHGGSRSTFEARGYTSWDLTSPIFIKVHENGKTLCIPTAFVSYLGDALDIKTPLLRSITQLSKAATKFLNLVNDSNREGDHDTHVDVSCGCEQEYFLIDKGLYFERPDLVMSGRTLFGAVTSRNQQLEDHYFGTVPERVMAFMQEVEVELYRLGIPAKTRHNEVAPGQFEIAPIFDKGNVANDQNQMVMAVLQSVAIKHDFVCLLHEKPFQGINGSGKHLNWSMGGNKYGNLLEPTDSPHTNYKFLAVVAMICEGVFRHGASLRTAIASHSNDHRLGANEAPPSIISVFLGDTLTKILEAYAKGESYTKEGEDFMDLGADQLARLVRDNTDRNRTSPFAFTGNKFEFRAVGSTANVGIPMTILNAAVTDVLVEMNERIEKEKGEGKAVDEILMGIIKDLYNNCSKIVFNGDGYSQEWEDEAAKRGLPNLRTSADALKVIADSGANAFLTKLGIYSENELKMRYNVRVERYCKHREIEFRTLLNIINKDIIPATIEYKGVVAEAIENQKECKIDPKVDLAVLNKLNEHLNKLYDNSDKLRKGLEGLGEEIEDAEKIAKELLPLSEEIADTIAYLEENVAEDLWPLPTYYDLLFIR